MRLKLTLLIALLSILWTTTSAQDTTRSILNKDTVKVPLEVARAIVKDLLRKDYLEFENGVLKQDTALLDSKVTIQDSIVRSYQAKESIYKSIQEDYKKTSSLYQESIRDLEHKNYRLKTKNFILDAALLVAVAFLVLKN